MGSYEFKHFCFCQMANGMCGHRYRYKICWGKIDKTQMLPPAFVYLITITFYMSSVHHIKPLKYSFALIAIVFRIYYTASNMKLAKCFASIMIAQQTCHFTSPDVFRVFLSSWTEKNILMCFKIIAKKWREVSET